MDFELDEAQRVIAESAAAVLKGANDAGWQVTWQAMSKAGLLALTLPDSMGGDGLGVLEAAVLLTEVGRAAATVPAFATVMLGTLPVVRWGSPDLQERLLAGVADGEVLLTAAVREQSSGRPAEPATTTAVLAAEPAGTVRHATGGPAAGADSVTGTKVGVPFAAQARWILVPASVGGGGRALVVVDAAGSGVRMCPTPASSDSPEYTVQFEAAPVVGVLPDEAVDDLYRLAEAGAAAMADGAVAGALALTAAYVASREQFGRPLATFQAVAGEAADIYITGRTLHLAALSAAWRISAGLDAGEDADVAAYWLAQEAPAALRTCHQLHGGIGVDISYPLHRYSAMISDLARFVGGADYSLDVLAARIAVDHGGAARND
jgi:3-oxo-4-pregnene-20-carboxyl-CoA dehydrogenase alpha subunit